jgi:glycosyltransferase involved in cell wall biosynthesis
MRVTHIAPALFGPDGVVGGAERYVLELARHMAARVQTTLVTFGDEDREDWRGALRVRVLGRPWLVRGQRFNPFSLGAFRELRDADVVHCHQQHVLMSSAAAAWSGLTGRPVFATELGGGGWDISAYVSTDAWFDGHLHLSEYSRRIFGHERHAGARIIGGGVDVDRFWPDPAVPCRGRVLFVGRLLPHKGVDDLLRALPRGVPLSIVGPEPDADTRTRLAALAGGLDVEFLHAVDDRALVRRYREALCVVLPSVYRMPDGRETLVPELLGQTLLEGMACGRPVVSTSVGSLPEVVDDGVTGFVVPPNDPAALGERLAWLSVHPSEADAMGRAGRRRVLERFTWPLVVDRCLEAYARAWSTGRVVAPAGRRRPGEMAS